MKKSKGSAKPKRRASSSLKLSGLQRVKQKYGKPLVIAAIFAVLGIGYLVVSQAEDVPSIQEPFNSAANFSVAKGPAWTIDGGKYRLQSNGTTPVTNNITLHNTPLSGDWELQVDVTAGSGSPGAAAVVFDYIDPTHFHYAVFGNSSDQSKNGIFKVDGGAPQQLARTSKYTVPGKTYIFKVRRTADRIRLYQGSTYLTIAPAPEPTGSFGFAAHTTGIKFDNLKVFGGVTSTPVPAPTPTPTPEPTPTPTPTPTPSPTPTGTLRTVNVSSAAQLTTALTNAKAGDLIQMADGVYKGQFRTSVKGTSTNPITLRGGRSAILEVGGTSSGYVFHLNGAAYWRLEGFTVRNGQKGIMLDKANRNLVHKVEIYNIGNEALHARANSSDNTFSENVIHDTGKAKADFGEGIYLGSAQSNWGTYTGGNPDRSDRNQVLNNNIYNTSAESIDIKEGTTGGLVKGNKFEGKTMSGANFADSWVDLKGNNYRIENNVGTNALLDGFQTHVILSGWGQNNTFTGNTATVNGPGYGFNIHKAPSGNVVSCTNKVSGAALGLANVACK